MIVIDNSVHHAAFCSYRGIVEASYTSRLLPSELPSLQMWNSKIISGMNYSTQLRLSFPNFSSNRKKNLAKEYADPICFGKTGYIFNGLPRPQWGTGTCLCNTLSQEQPSRFLQEMKLIISICHIHNILGIKYTINIYKHSMLFNVLLNSLILPSNFVIKLQNNKHFEHSLCRIIVLTFSSLLRNTVLSHHI